MMDEPQTIPKYRFKGRTGCRFHPALDSAHTHLALGHTAGLAPWRDEGLHSHHTAEAGFHLLAGRLDFGVAGCLITLLPDEFLLIRPGVPHAIMGGEGKIERFDIRAPAVDDKQARGPLPLNLKLAHEDSHLVGEAWGRWIPLDRPPMFASAGREFYSSPHLNLGYFHIPSAAVADFYLQSYQGVSAPWELWTYYLVFQGRQILQMEDGLTTVGAGELLEVPPLVQPIYPPYRPTVPGRHH